MEKYKRPQTEMMLSATALGRGLYSAAAWPLSSFAAGTAKEEGFKKGINHQSIFILSTFVLLCCLCWLKTSR